MDAAEVRRQQQRWYRARDMVLGMNCRQQDVEGGLQVARSCSSADATWLCQLFSKGAPKSYEAVQSVFVLSHNQDGRSLCFEALVGRSVDVTKLKTAAGSRFGSALAQGAFAAVMLEVRAVRSQCLAFG